MRIVVAHLVPQTPTVEVLTLNGDVEPESLNEEGTEEGAAHDWRADIAVDDPFKEATDALICALTPFTHMWDRLLGHIDATSHRMELTEDAALVYNSFTSSDDAAWEIEGRSTEDVRSR